MIYGNDSNNVIPDPLSIGQSNNLYGYTLNNPLKYIDPTGLCCEDEDGDSFWSRLWDELLPSFDSIGGWFSLTSDTVEWTILSILALVERGIRSATPRNNIGIGVFEKWRNRALDGLNQTRGNVSRIFGWIPYVLLALDVGIGFFNNLLNGESLTRSGSDAAAQITGGVFSIQVGGAVSTAVSGASFWASIGSGAKKGGILGTFKIPGVGTVIGVVVGGISGAVTYAVLNASGIIDAISNGIYNGIRWVQNLDSGNTPEAIFWSEHGK